MMTTIKQMILAGMIVCSSILAAAENNEKTVAFAQDTMANDFRKAQVYEVRDAFKKYPNIHFVSSDAKGKTALLISQINNFIDTKTDLPKI